MTVCPVCRGRGEVAAGITYGFVCTGHDELGNELGYPMYIRPNPQAKDKNGVIWIVQENPLCELWGIALCAKCHGTGMV